MSNLKHIDWWSVELGNVEIENLKSTLNSGFPNEGPVTNELEKHFKEYFGVKHAILTTSGTVAIYLGLKALGIGPGDRVGVPNLTFIATANAVSLCGASPVLIDVREESLCIDHKIVEAEHLFSPLSAVIPVHVSGRSANTSELLNTLSRLKIPFVEDAAEAFGSINPITRCYLGTEGIVGAFSFSPNKIITSGQGGLVVTNSDQLASSIRELKDQGRPQRGSGGDDLHNSVGFNFKYTDLQASVLLGQLTKLDSRKLHLIHVYEQYRELLNSGSGLMNFQTKQGEFPLWPEICVQNRPQLEQKLTENNIGFRRIWHPLSSQIPYKNDQKKFRISEKVSRSTIWLPSAFNLDEDKLKRITATINDFRKAP